MPVHDPAAVRRDSLQKYRQRAAAYDETCAPTWPFRVRSVELMALTAGETAVDVGCGTGLSFPLLREGVGPTGYVYGFEQSPEMAAQARERVIAAGWTNVEVIEAGADTVVIPRKYDAILFNYTHDICRSPTAVNNVLSQARVGARVAMCGVKFFPWWAAPLNLYVYIKNRAYNGFAGELATPWDIVGRDVALDVSPTQYGMGYIASGRVERPPVNQQRN